MVELPLTRMSKPRCPDKIASDYEAVVASEAVHELEEDYKTVIALLEDSTRIMYNIHLKMDNILLKRQLEHNKRFLLAHGRYLDE